VFDKFYKLYFFIYFFFQFTVSIAKFFHCFMVIFEDCVHLYDMQTKFPLAISNGTFIRIINSRLSTNGVA